MANKYNPLLKRIAIGMFPVCAGGSWFMYTKMQGISLTSKRTVKRWWWGWHETE